MLNNFIAIFCFILVLAFNENINYAKAEVEDQSVDSCNGGECSGEDSHQDNKAAEDIQKRESNEFVTLPLKHERTIIVDHGGKEIISYSKNDVFEAVVVRSGYEEKISADGKTRTITLKDDNYSHIVGKGYTNQEVLNSLLAGGHKISKTFIEQINSLEGKFITIDGKYKLLIKNGINQVIYKKLKDGELHKISFRIIKSIEKINKDTVVIELQGMSIATSTYPNYPLKNRRNSLLSNSENTPSNSNQEVKLSSNNGNNGISAQDNPSSMSFNSHDKDKPGAVSTKDEQVYSASTNIGKQSGVINNGSVAELNKTNEVYVRSANGSVTLGDKKEKVTDSNTDKQLVSIYNSPYQATRLTQKTSPNPSYDANAGKQLVVINNGSVEELNKTNEVYVRSANGSVTLGDKKEKLSDSNTDKQLVPVYNSSRQATTPIQGTSANSNNDANVGKQLVVINNGGVAELNKTNEVYLMTPSGHLFKTNEKGKASSKDSDKQLVPAYNSQYQATSPIQETSANPSYDANTGKQVAVIYKHKIGAPSQKDERGNDKVNSINSTNNFNKKSKYVRHNNTDLNRENDDYWVELPSIDYSNSVLSGAKDK